MARNKDTKLNPEEKAEALTAKAAALKALVNESADSAMPLEVVAEPRQWEFPNPFSRSSLEEGDILAVYGSEEMIAALDAQKILVSATSDRFPRGNYKGRVKAYLNYKEVDYAHIKNNCSITSAAQPLLPLVKNDKNIHALGICHSAYMLADGTGDTVSYLVVSADREADFKHILERLGPDPTQYKITQEFGRKEFILVMPIRRSMAQAIEAAHPEAVHMESQSLGNAAPDVATIRHVYDMVEQYPQFQAMELVSSSGGPQEEPRPSTTQMARPLSAFVEEIEPDIQRIVRHESLNGSTNYLMHCQPSPKLHDAITRMANPKLCEPPVKISGHGRLYSLKDAYTSLKPHLGNVQPEITYQTIPSKLLDSRDVVVGSDTENGRTKNKYESYGIDELQLCHVGEAEASQHWLVVRAQHVMRLEPLAANLGYSAQQVQHLTGRDEVPALIALPLGKKNGVDTGAALAEQLLADENLDLEPMISYSAFGDMQNALRARAGVAQSTDTSTIPPSTPTPQKWTRTKPPPADTQALRQATATVFFARNVKRHWLTVAPPSARLSDDISQHELVVLGLSVPTAKAKEFAASISGQVKRIPGWTFAPAGVTGDGEKKRSLYALKMPPAEAEVFAGQQEEDIHPREPNRFMVEADIHRAVREAMGVAETAATKKVALDNDSAAWARLAQLTKEAAIDVCAVRYDQAALNRDAEELRAQVAGVRDWIKRAEQARLLQQRHRDTPSAAGSKLIRSRMDRMFELFDKHVTSIKTNTARSSAPIDKAGIASLAVIQQYQQWVKKNADSQGQAILPHLVLKNPSAATVHALQTLSAISVRRNGKKVRLLPIPPSVYSVGDRTQMYACPVNPEFFEELKNHGGSLGLSHLPVIESELLDTHIRETYGKTKPKEDRVVALKPRQIQRDERNAVLNALKHSKTIRNAIVYAELKEDHNFNYEELRQQTGDDVARHSIGLQPALMINIASKRDWSSNLCPFVEHLSTAGYSAPRQYYLHIPTVEEMEVLERNIDRQQNDYRQLGKLQHELTQCLGSDPSIRNPEGLCTVAASIKEACINREFADLRIHPMVHTIVESQGHISPEQSEVLRKTLHTMRDEIREQIDALQTKYEATERAREEAFEQAAQGIVRADPEPLCYLQASPEGHSLESLDDVVSGHFSQTDAPLRIVLHLDQEKLRGEKKDQELVAALVPPTKPVPGKWTSEFSAPATSGISMETLFADQKKHFPSRQLG